MILLLAACFVTDADRHRRVDADGDGVRGSQVGGPDCDDGDATIGAGPYGWTDADGDGFGDDDARGCDPDGVPSGGDCDDGDATAHPGATEDCGAADLDCDGEADDCRFDTEGVAIVGLEAGSGAGVAALGVGDLGDDGFGELLIGLPGRHAVVALSGAAAARDTGWSIGAPLFDYVGDDGRIGASLAAGDFLGRDGVVDLAVGVPSTTGQGTVDWLQGPFNVGATRTRADITQTGTGDLGWAMASADVDGSGTSDVLVSAPDGLHELGDIVFLLRTPPADEPAGSANGEFYTTMEGGLAPRLGASVALGDMDGDGRADAVMGAPGYGEGGAVFVCLGVPSGPVNAEECGAVYADTPDDELGAAVAAADVDGDGEADLVVGVPGADDDTLADVGEVRLYIGGTLDGADAVLIGDPVAGGRAGDALAAVGDVDGDDANDLAVGAPDLDEPAFGEQAGAVWLVAGAPWPGSAALSDVASARWVCPQAACRGGAMLAPGGDVDGDGFDEWLAGAPGWMEAGENVGAVFVFFGE